MGIAKWWGRRFAPTLPVGADAEDPEQTTCA
jgi:hypothetical protein